MGENALWSTGFQAAEFASDASSVKTYKEKSNIGQTLKNSKGIGEVMKPSNRSEGLELGRKLDFSSAENLRSVRVYGIFIHFSYTYLNRF